MLNVQPVRRETPSADGAIPDHRGFLGETVRGYPFRLAVDAGALLARGRAVDTARLLVCLEGGTAHGADSIEHGLLSYRARGRGPRPVVSGADASDRKAPGVENVEV